MLPLPSRSTRRLGAACALLLVAPALALAPSYASAPVAAAALAGEVFTPESPGPGAFYATSYDGFNPQSGLNDVIRVAADGTFEELSLPAPLDDGVWEFSEDPLEVLPGEDRLLVEDFDGDDGFDAFLVDRTAGTAPLLATDTCARGDLDETATLLLLPLIADDCRPRVLPFESPGEVRLAPEPESSLSFFGESIISADGSTVVYVNGFSDANREFAVRIISWDLETGTQQVLASTSDVREGDTQTRTQLLLLDVTRDGRPLVARIVEILTFDAQGLLKAEYEHTLEILPPEGDPVVIDRVTSRSGGLPWRQVRISPDGEWLLGLLGSHPDATQSRALPYLRALDSIAPWQPVLGLPEILRYVEWAPAPVEETPPVVFMPGVLGSEIWCDPADPDSDRLWPDLPVDEEAMALQADGLLNASALDCPRAGVRDAHYGEGHRLLPGESGVAESLLGTDIYGEGLRRLAETVGPDRFYAFGWDWRRDTDASIDRLDALIEQVREETGSEQVQLVAHSYGGLLALDYASDPARRDKLARVTTVGTPYLGAAKSPFSLITGSETPFDIESLGTMEFLFGGTDDLNRFARNLRGMYNLWPSAAYGPYFSVADGTGSGALDAEGIAQRITAAGGTAALWEAAQAKHAALWDRLDIGDLPWHLVVAGGKATIRRFTLLPPESEADPLRVGVTLAAGDGTVPLVSQTLLGADSAPAIDLGAIGGTHPALGTSQLCASAHAGQMADPRLYALVGDWLASGERPSADLDIPCREPAAIVVETIDADLAPDVPAPSAPARRRTAQAEPTTLDAADAVATGRVQLVNLGRQQLLLLEPDDELTLTFRPRPGATMVIRTSKGAVTDTTHLDEVARTTEPVTLTLREPDPEPDAVRTPSTMGIRATSPAPGVVRLRIRIGTTDVSPDDLTGRITIRRRGTELARRTVADDVLVLTLRRQPPGRRYYRIGYSGNDLIIGTRRTIVVRVDR